MKRKKTEFSLGTFNSELQEQEIQIPDGYEASIEGGKIIFRKKESEDEKIRKVLVGFFKGYKEEGTIGSETFNGIPTDNILTWLEEQGKCKSFEYNGHIWGMCARNNGVDITLDGELKAFLSLENSFIYPIHPQPSIESIPTQNITSEAKAEPKFHEGDWIVFNGLTLFIEEVVQGYYRTTSINDIHNSYDWSIDNVARLWTTQDAKYGDILTCYSSCNDESGKPFKQTGKLKQYIGKHGGCSNCFLAQIGIDWNGNIKTNLYMGSPNIFPATKEQRDYFFAETSKAGFNA